jgi:hypothetical protein
MTMIPHRLLLISLSLILCACVLMPAPATAAEGDKTPIYLRPEALEAEKQLQAIKYRAKPDDIYNAFNNFVKNVYGAEADELIYEKLGRELKLLDGGEWAYASEKSAALGWETNLPATSHVEYGPTAELGEKTGPHERHFFLHIHHVTGLEPGKTYHYRFVGVDERGNTLRGPVKTFTTQKAGAMTPIGADHEEGPITIDKPGKYVLVKDITSKTSGINIEADGVTLDLGGHTVTYATETVAEGLFTDKWRSYEKLGPIGIRNMGKSKFTLLNGTVKQGVVGPFENTGNDDSSGFNPVFIRDMSDVRIAGLVVDFNSRQNTGILLRNVKDSLLLHHNIIRDRGNIVRNRHGAGCRAIYVLGGGEGKERVLRHNLIARTRQFGLNLRTPGGHMHNNELYIDSWSTNSFGMGLPDGADENDEGHYNNRIFMTGFNPYGMGWAAKHLRVHDNFIYLHGLKTEHRWHEDWGDTDLLAGLRVTNYGGGGQQREDLKYYDNLIIMRGKQGADVQGTRFFSDATNKDIVFYNNVVKYERLDDVPARNSGAIVTHGYFRKKDTLPLYYRDSKLISNHVLVQFGEAYGKGNNHRFVDCEFVKIGDRDDFATFRFGGRYHSSDHIILDGVFKGGAAPDDVFWELTGKSSYSVAWTLTLKAPAGAEVKVTDAKGEVAFTGKVGDDGKLAIPLTEATYAHGSGPRKSDVTKYTPHTVEVTVNGKTTSHKVEMTQQRELEIK